MQELTSLCQEVTGVSLPIGQPQETTGVDIPYYVPDNTLAGEVFSWEPVCTPREIVSDVFQWLKENNRRIESALF